MGEPYNIKARVHHGSESLDITIPAEIKREYGISPGDVFLVSADDAGEQLTLEYKRIHKQDE